MKNEHVYMISMEFLIAAIDAVPSLVNDADE